MKILLATIDYLPAHGGVANYYANLVKHWPQPGLLSVLDNSRSELVDERRGLIKWWPAFKAIRRRHKAKDFDHLLVGQLLPIGTVAYYLKKLFKLRYSVIIHGMDFAFAMRVTRKKAMARKILAAADKIVCSNTFVASQVKEFVGSDQQGKVDVVFPGIDSQVASPRDEAEQLALRKQYGLEGKFVILSLSRLVKRKGADQVILSLTKLIDRLPEIAYVIAGSGPDEEYLKHYAQSVSNRFAGHIKFIGAVDDHLKWQLFHACDVYAMPSRNDNGDFEGFGIVYLEAGLCGKPVIGGRSGGISDAVVDGVTGFLVEPTDTDQIADALKRILDDPGYGRRLGEQGKARALADFQWQDQAQRFYEIITGKK